MNTRIPAPYAVCVCDANAVIAMLNDNAPMLITTDMSLIDRELPTPETDFDALASYAFSLSITNNRADFNYIALTANTLLISNDYLSIRLNVFYHIDTPIPTIIVSIV